MAAGAPLGPRRPGASPGRRRRAAHVDRRGRPRGAGVQQRPPAAHGHRWPQRRVRCGSPGVRRRRPRRHRAGRRGRRRCHVGHRRGAPRHVRAGSRRRTPQRPRAVGRALPAELRPGDRRRLGCVTRRRPVLHALRQDRGHGRRPRGRSRRRHGDPYRWRPRGRCRPRPDTTARRLGGHAGRDHTGVAAGASGSHPRATRRLRIPLVLRRGRGVPADPASGCHPGGPAPVRRCRVTARAGRRRHPVHAARARRRSRRTRRRHDVDRRPLLSR